MRLAFLFYEELFHIIPSNGAETSTQPEGVSIAIFRMENDSELVPPARFERTTYGSGTGRGRIWFPMI